MKVTDEMVEAFRIGADWPGMPRVQIRNGLEVILALIDPVPELVCEVVDSDGDHWKRTIDPLVWQRGHQKHSIGFINKLYGPITWEGKAG